jgi:hypothetical protein
MGWISMQSRGHRTWMPLNRWVAMNPHCRTVAEATTNLMPRRIEPLFLQYVRNSDSAASTQGEENYDVAPASTYFRFFVCPASERNRLVSSRPTRRHHWVALSSGNASKNKRIAPTSRAAWSPTSIRKGPPPQSPMPAEADVATSSSIANSMLAGSCADTVPIAAASGAKSSRPVVQRWL